MILESVQLIAGSVASMIFATGTLNMLYKAWHTKDLQAYSIANLVLSNGGNALYWLYLAGLPFGPVHLMHSFYTLAMLLMLAWFLMYSHRPRAVRHVTQTVKQITRTVEIPRLQRHSR